jgi:periplasmic copper chaperone A
MRFDKNQLATFGELGGVDMRKLIVGAVMLNLGATGAFAHVVFNQSTLAPAALATLELRVTHGCNGSPTTLVQVKIPEGVTRVTPRALAGWQISETKRRLPTPVMMHGETVTETVESITWSGGSFPDFAYQQFEIRAMMPARPGAALYFPVEQTCASGSHSWSQIPAAGANVESPAPSITLSGPAINSAAERPKAHRH